MGSLTRHIKLSPPVGECCPSAGVTPGATPDSQSATKRRLKCSNNYTNNTAVITSDREVHRIVNRLMSLTRQLSTALSHDYAHKISSSENKLDLCVCTQTSECNFCARQHMYIMLSALYTISRLSVYPSHRWISQKRLKVRLCNFHHTVAPSL